MEKTGKKDLEAGDSPRQLLKAAENQELRCFQPIFAPPLVMQKG
jgi:hypothetical protein